jgi:uncharacterized protein (TIGR02466 family)
MIIKNINSKSAIVSMFPKTVYYTKDVLPEDVVEILADALLNSNIETVKDTRLSVNSSHRTLNELHKIPEFKGVADAIMIHCKEYGKLLGYSDQQLDGLFMTNMWFNRSGKGDFNFPHNHPGSVFSGAFYLKATSENKIFFHNFDNCIIPDNVNDYQNSESWLQCTAGHLIIFQGDLIHSNPRQKEDGEKIVISFNIIKNWEQTT